MTSRGHTGTDNYRSLRHRSANTSGRLDLTTVTRCHLRVVAVEDVVKKIDNTVTVAVLVVVPVHIRTHSLFSHAPYTQAQFIHCVSEKNVTLFIFVVSVLLLVDRLQWI